MSNSQNAAMELLNEWQSQMEKYLKDPQTANKMMEFYAGFQKFSESNFTKQSESNSSKSNFAGHADVSDELIIRIERLESKLSLLEAAVTGLIKDINNAK